MPKTQQSTSYQLLNWNCPRRLKTQLDAIVDYKRVSRTSIVNTLLADYCRNETVHIKEDSQLTTLIASAIKKVNKPQPPSPQIPEKKSTRSHAWESSYT